MPELPLIVGAGPVGVAAALFLARNGTPTRLIERIATRSTHSKALAVNPRTLELLEPTGVTHRMLAMGKPIRGARFWGGSHQIAEIDFNGLSSRFPFMLALSQSTSERLLEEALVALGGRIERGTELADCRAASGDKPREVTASLRPVGHAEFTEAIRPPWILAADGARSTVRHCLDIDFSGSTFKTEWALVDLPLEISLAEDMANVLFLPGGGFVFMLRVFGDDVAPQAQAPNSASPNPARSDSASSTSAPLWRIMGDVPDPVAHVKKFFDCQAGTPTWTSSFRIGHRLADRLQFGSVYLAGDAAHIHSPAGARGMNLGIEDAWEFSQRLANKTLDRYGESRRRIDGAVVRRIAAVSRLARGESLFARLARSTLVPLLPRVPFIRRQMLTTLTGLDHELSTS